MGDQVPGAVTEWPPTSRSSRASGMDVVEWRWWVFFAALFGLGPIGWTGVDVEDGLRLRLAGGWRSFVGKTGGLVLMAGDTRSMRGADSSIPLISESLLPRSLVDGPAAWSVKVDKVGLGGRAA